MQRRIRIIDVLYPHKLPLFLAFLAVLGTSITDVLEPWPLKIVFDHVFASKRMPDWLASIVSYIGTDKFSILNFAVLAVIVVSHMVDGFILSPIVLKETTNLHPVIILLAVIVGAELLGFWGILAAIPVAGVIQFGLREWVVPRITGRAVPVAEGPRGGLP